MGASKFLDGAWIAVLLIPILVALFLQVRGRQKEIEGPYEPLSPIDLNSNFGYEIGMER